MWKTRAEVNIKEVKKPWYKSFWTSSMVKIFLVILKTHQKFSRLITDPIKIMLKNKNIQILASKKGSSKETTIAKAKKLKLAIIKIILWTLRVYWTGSLSICIKYLLTFRNEKIKSVFNITKTTLPLSQSALKRWIRHP